MRRDHDPSVAQPVPQCLTAKTAVVESRQNRVQIAGSLSLQLGQKFVDRRGADRKREDSLSPFQTSTFFSALPFRMMTPL
jgi:hypothetical protein